MILFRGIKTIVLVMVLSTVLAVVLLFMKRGNEMDSDPDRFRALHHSNI